MMDYNESELFTLLGLELRAHYRYTSNISKQVARCSENMLRKGKVESKSLWFGQWYRRPITQGLCGPLVARWINPHFGWGVFAQKNIAKGDFLTVYLGEIRPIRKKIVNRYCFAFPFKAPWASPLGNWTIDALSCGNISRFINHSDSPNCSCQLVYLSPWPYIVIKASRNIQAGEQIAYDYGPQYWRHLEKTPLPHS